MRVKYAVLVVALGAVVAGSVGLGHEARAASGRPAAAALTDVSTAPAQSASADERTGEVIVKFRRSATLGDVGEALADADSEATASSAGSGLVLLDPAPGQTDDDAIASLRARGDVEFAEPNHVVHIVATPTDPLYASNQWSLPQIGLPTAWNTSTGSASTIVAVIDTGVDAAHPDLSGKMTTGANAGYNFVGGNTNTTDDHFHGTFVASIVAANTNNGAGGAGVCWACKIMPIKVLDSTGSGSTFNVAQGVDWAVSHGAKVINMSLGSSSSDATLLTAVNAAWTAGVIVVAASGNNDGPTTAIASSSNLGGLVQITLSANATYQTGNQILIAGHSVPAYNGVKVITVIDSTHFSLNGTAFSSSGTGGTSKKNPAVLYPAAYTNAIAVGSNNQAGAKSSFSNYGAELDIMAPGESVFGALCTCGAYAGGYGTGSGTSFAAPHLAGVVGLLISAGITNKDTIRTKLQTTTTDMDAAGFDNNTGWGRVNAAAAISTGTPTPTPTRTNTPTSTPTRTPTATATPVETTPPTVNITLPAPNQVVSGQLNATVNATDGSGIQTVKFWMDNVYQGNDSTPAYGWSWNTVLLSNGIHRILVEASDIHGNKAWHGVNFIVTNNDVTPPVVSITSPTTGQSVSGSITAQISATDDATMSKVRFWLDGVYKGYDVTLPYGLSINTTLLTNGTHRLLVEAADVANNKSYAAVNFVVNN